MEISVGELEQIRYEYLEKGKRLENLTVVRRLERQLAKYESSDAAKDMAWVLQNAIALIKGENK